MSDCWLKNRKNFSIFNRTKNDIYFNDFLREKWVITHKLNRNADSWTDRNEISYKSRLCMKNVTFAVNSFPVDFSPRN